MKTIDSIIKKKLVILDGAIGTQLQKLGLPAAGCPEIWCLKNRPKLAFLHKEYKRAGADVIYTATFGANRVKLKEYSCRRIEEINKSLALTAREAAGKNTLVAGSIGPTGKLIQPFGDFSFEEAISVFKEQIKGLLAAEVDFFVIETMLDIQEARAALIAAKELSDKFTAVSMSFEKDGFTLGGTDPLTALITLQSLGADCFGCNCSTGPASMVKVIEKIKSYATVPILAKPNAGLPKLKKGQTFFDMNPEKFASFLPLFIQAGANLLGGCCGTDYGHIQALRSKARSRKTQLPAKKSLAALSSAGKNYIFGDNKPLAVVGECINPAGKRRLTQQLKEGKLSIVKELAQSQERAGADILDINIDLAGADQEKLIRELIKLLAGNSLPLAIDSSSPKIIEKFLRFYPGRAIINSISAEKKKNKKLFSLAAKYGAMFIGLPLDGKDLPKNFEARKENVNAIFKRAKEFNLSQDDFIVDALALAISAGFSSPQQTLKTINWAKKQGYRTIVGLSNLSFGLPQRELLNASFLNLAQAQGLDCVIANPLSERVMTAKEAGDFILKKENSAVFLNKIKTQGKKVWPAEKGLNKAEKRIFHLILDGRKEEVKKVLEEAVLQGALPHSLVNKTVTPALEQVGKLFDERIFFLPQLVASAETAKAAFKFLQPKLKKKNKIKKKTVIILATVKDDVHDIGKNIVALMLENHGFEVVDLGKNVSAPRIIEAVRAHKAPLVGLSALMTTTMVNMEEVVELAEKKNLKCKFLVGGAVVTKGYARRLGAAYASDSLEAVRVADKLKKK